MAVPMAFFSFLVTLISLVACVLIVMLIVRSVQQGRVAREKAFRAALDRGVYDPKLIRSTSSGGSRAASLGWGIFFFMVGIALLIGLGTLGVLADAALGGLIPLAIGVGLISFYIIMKRSQKDIEHNGDPIRFDPKVGQPVEKSDGGTGDEESYES